MGSYAVNVEMRLGFKWLETARLQNVRDDWIVKVYKWLIVKVRSGWSIKG